MVKRGRGLRVRAAVVGFALLAGGWQCDGEESPRHASELLVRRWAFHRFLAGPVGETPVGEDRLQVGGTVMESVDFGGLTLIPPGEDPEANAEVFSSDTGSTYWVWAEAPMGLVEKEQAIGNSADLIQYQYFRKKDAGARLQIVVSKVFLDGIDGNPGLPTALECPWHSGSSYVDCRRTMRSWASFQVSAFDFRTQKNLFSTGGFVELFGWQGNWDYDAYTSSGATRPLWNRTSFDFDPSVDSDVGARAQVTLPTPITIDVPLSTVEVGDLFYVLTSARVDTLNRRQRESYLASYFRDPQTAEGMALLFEGLEAVETPTELPVASAPAPAPACASPDTAAGTIELAAGAIDDAEQPGDGATVVVTRSGGGQGAVSAHIATSDGSARAGADYTAVDTEVLFADGEEGSRAVRIPLVVDDLAEPDETLTVTLSQPGGCAALGATSSAIVTIQDDDNPIDRPPTFTVAGAVSGLEGTGLVLSEAITGFELTPDNGDFAFDYQFPSGTDYEVRVASQPIDPIQVCSVARASGTVTDTDVTDVAVTCVTPATGEGLDPTFGEGGRVTTGLPGGAVAMALQPDGKIVLVGGLRMARYESDGDLDPSFGDAGVVEIVFNGGLLDEAHGVAIQPDGRILVAGVTRVGAQDDFAVNRYLADGTLDGSFGGDGRVSTDFAGQVDRAYAVLVQTDGRIVVVGHAGAMTPLGVGSDFAAARYTSAGVLDGDFGSGGRVTIDIGGRTDLAYAAALQPDGRILIAGRVADGGGDSPDIGLVRLDEIGDPDPGFADQGVRRTDFGDWDEASGVALEPDGQIVVSTQTLVGPTFLLAVARYGAEGALDTEFGTDGLATAAFSGANDYAHAVAVQPDGRILVAGQSSNLSAPDFAIARFDAAGVLDGGFDGDGMRTVDFFGASDGAQCMAVQPDGKIVAAGFARNGTATGLGMVRLLPGS